MLTVTHVLVFVALILTIGAAIGRVPVWIPLLLVVLVLMLELWPAK